MTVKVTLVDRSDFGHPEWSAVIREGFIQRVPIVNSAEDLLIPIMDTEDDLIVDVTNLYEVIQRLRRDSSWRLVERALCSKRGGILSKKPLSIDFNWASTNYCVETGVKLLNNGRPAINVGPGVGNWLPGKVILLIGEKPGNEKAVTRKDYAFLSSSGSSGWLCKRLDDIKFPERDIYWINAQNREGDWTDASFISALQPTQIFALGGIANTWCAMNDIKAEAHNHPQYWKRFKSKQEYPLITKLRCFSHSGLA